MSNMIHFVALVSLSLVPPSLCYSSLAVALIEVLSLDFDFEIYVKAFVNPYFESSRLQISPLYQPSLNPNHSHRFIFEIQSDFDFDLEAPPPPPSAPARFL
ncbi:unnamed protein product [Camellia sinensis]